VSFYTSFIILRSKPKGVVEAISGLLSSTRPDDAISSELADLVGFEDIELVTELLTSRSYFVNAVSVATTSRHIQSLTLPSYPDGNK
jgi:antiviral helicase SLH1